MRNRLAILLMTATLASATLTAHEGHRHVMGTISAADATHLEVKSRDGEMRSVPLGPGTKYFKGKSEGTGADAKPGLRVVIDLDAEGKASEVRLPSGPSAAPRPKS